jgi:hypothetical protein
MKPRNSTLSGVSAGSAIPVLFSHSQKGVAFVSFLLYYNNKVNNEPKGLEASRLRQRKFELVRRFQLPDHLLPGSLSLSHLRCGKPTCHCATDKQRHPVWSLTFMLDGKKHVQHIPKDWVEDVRRRVEAGREYQDAVREVLAANAQLLVLARRQRRRLR